MQRIFPTGVRTVVRVCRPLGAADDHHEQLVRADKRNRGLRAHRSADRTVPQAVRHIRRERRRDAETQQPPCQRRNPDTPSVRSQASPSSSRRSAGPHSTGRMVQCQRSHERATESQRPCRYCWPCPRVTAGSVVALCGRASLIAIGQTTHRFPDDGYGGIMRPCDRVGRTVDVAAIGCPARRF
jgi:hypothetical protein